MRVLLVEPASQKTTRGSGKQHRSEETKWYPPLSLMKLARFHKNRGDEVRFVRGCDATLFAGEDFYSSAEEAWDRVYITTVFTFHFKEVVKTIKFYLEAVGGTVSKVYVGGIAASLMAEDFHEATGIWPITGILSSAEMIGFKDDHTNIDELPPDYTVIDGEQYAINDTFYAYASRGCTLKCAWCGVPKIEPTFDPYLNIKNTVRTLREEYGDFSLLRLMDNNIIASKNLKQIVDDLKELGYGKNEYTKTANPKQRIVDFNQGLDATYFNKETVGLMSQLNIRPMRIAFDRANDHKAYTRAVTLSHAAGITDFSNYLLYNWKDSPQDLFDRLVINIQMNEQWEEAGRKAGQRSAVGSIYCYPMRFAPINNDSGQHENQHREMDWPDDEPDRNWGVNPVWTRRFIRNIEVMKGAANGAISPTSKLARRTVGRNFDEFLLNLYMPEELLRNRNRYEKTVYAGEPPREPGDGKVEAFREFMAGLLKSQDQRFRFFHAAVSPNRQQRVRKAMAECPEPEMREWLDLYIRKNQGKQQLRLESVTK